MAHLDQRSDGKPAGPSADDCLDALEEKLERMAASDFDRAEIERMIGLLGVQMPLRTTFDSETAWSELEARHPLFFTEEAEDRQPSPCSETSARPGRRPRRRMSNLLVAVLAAAALLAGMMTAQAMGLDVFGTLARWTDEEFQFTAYPAAVEHPSPQDRPAVNETISFDNLEAALETYGITTPLLPTWLPEGFVCAEASVVGSTMITFYDALYKKGDERIGLGINEANPGEQQVFAVYEKNENEVVCYECNGIKHYIFYNVGNTVISWVNGEFECYIDGYFDLGTAEKIIDSIY